MTITKGDIISSERGIYEVKAKVLGEFTVHYMDIEEKTRNLVPKKGDDVLLTIDTIKHDLKAKSLEWVN